MNLLYLSRKDVESLQIPMASIITVVEEGFRLKGLGQTQMPPKTPVRPRGLKTFLHAMPAYVGGEVDAAALKWVGGSDDNHLLGLPTITGLMILNDPQTMLPVAVMDCTWITAMRTAAANAVAMKHLGPKNPQEAGIIGCGVQGRSNLLAMHTLYPSLKYVKVHDLDPQVQERYIREMTALTGLQIESVEDPADAVRESDLIVTACYMPPDAKPFIEESWLKPGAMASPVDYNCHWKAEVAQRVDKFVTDDLPQMDYYRSKGYFQDIPQPWELGEVVAGLKPGREDPEERSMSMCMGIGIDDAVTAKLVYQTAVERKLGVELPL